jgi:tRNA(Ile)-lysidine synthase
MGNRQLIERFEANGVKHGFLRQGMRIMIGISGGADSVAMTMMFFALREKYALVLMCAHINYNLRGEDSKCDEQYVKELCFSLNIPLYILSASICKRESVQQRAREIRFEYLLQLKKHYHMDYIAWGHQFEDQSETVLHRFIRGAGLTGLAGIRTVNQDIIHPLLIFKKEELVRYLEQKNISYRTDKTNFTNTYTRNQIRNELIPHISEKYNLNIENRLFEYSQLFFQADDFLKKVAAKEFKRCLIALKYNGVNARDIRPPKNKPASDVVLCVETLKKTPQILLFYIFREAWRLLTGSENDFFSVHFNDIVALLDSENGYKEVILPDGIVVSRDYTQVSFIATAHRGDAVIDREKVLTGLRSSFSFNDKRFTMQKVRILPEMGLKTPPETIIIDYDLVVFPVTLRYRTDGDKFIPFGNKSYKKLKDYFIDSKVSKPLRDEVILWTDAQKIFWVCGHRIDQRVAVTRQTSNYLVITAENNTDFRKIKMKEY